MTQLFCVQLVEWLGIRLRVPAEWEIVRHSLGTLKGGLTFVDRRRQRLQLRWTQCKKPPLLDRMLSDHTARQLKEDPDAQIEPFTFGQWQGLVRELDEGDSPRVMLTRAAWYDDQDKVLIEAIFTHDADEAALRDELLESVELVQPLDQATRWQAFGLVMETPPDFRATTSVVSAGEASFTFYQLDRPGGEKTRPGRATLCRMGLADGWFAGNLEKLLRAQNPKVRFDCVETMLSEKRTGGDRATALTARSIEPGPRLKRWAGRLRTRRDLLWHDPSANAVFHIHTLSFDPHPVEPTDFRLHPAREVA